MALQATKPNPKAVKSVFEGIPREYRELFPYDPIKARRYCEYQTKLRETRQKHNAELQALRKDYADLGV